MAATITEPISWTCLKLQQFGTARGIYESSDLTVHFPELFWRVNELRDEQRLQVFARSLGLTKWGDPNPDPIHNNHPCKANNISSISMLTLYWEKDHSIRPNAIDSCGMSQVPAFAIN